MKDPATNKVGQIGDTLQFTKSHPTVVLGELLLLNVKYLLWLEAKR